MLDSSTSIELASLTAIGIVVLSTTILLALLARSRISKPAHDPSTSAILITGGGRGIGRATADHLLSLGYHVFVTVRKQSPYDAMESKARKGVEDSHAPHPVLLDVSNDDHIESAGKRVQSLCQSLNCQLIAVINNAGINPEGDAMSEVYANDGTPENVLADPSIGTRVLQTNVVGVARISRAFLPLLSEGGRIVNIGSYFGSIAGQSGLCHAYYECSKFALEGLSDNMRRSLRKRGIHVSLIKPGNIITDMNSFGESPTSVVAKDVEHAVSSKSPRARYYSGKVKGMPVRLVCWIFEMLPTSVTDAL